MHYLDALDALNSSKGFTLHNTGRSRTTSITTDDATSFESLMSTSSKRKNTEEQRAKKQRLAEEKAAKAAASEKNKMYKPGECMKHMNIEMHPSLSSVWYMSDVVREAAAAGCRLVSATDLCDPALLMWTRTLQPSLALTDGQLGLTTKERCPQALYISQVDVIADHVVSHTLSQHMGQIKEMASCELTLIVFGVKNYFKSSGRKTSNSKNKLMTEIDLEMAVTDLLVTADCDTILVDTSNELALTIIQFTKAIAEAPHKHAKRAVDEQAEFYMRGDKKQSVAVDKDGNGLNRLWQQMLAILPLSSLETSRAICAQYTSPLDLYKALQSSNGVNDLADVGVSRAAVPGTRARRIGPEFARKLHTLFTSEDGNVLLD